MERGCLQYAESCERKRSLNTRTGSGNARWASSMNQTRRGWAGVDFGMVLLTVGRSDSAQVCCSSQR